jgi:hypothetical protein
MALNDDKTLSRLKFYFLYFYFVKTMPISQNRLESATMKDEKLSKNWKCAMVNVCELFVGTKTWSTANRKIRNDYLYFLLVVHFSKVIWWLKILVFEILFNVLFSFFVLFFLLCDSINNVVKFLRNNQKVSNPNRQLRRVSGKNCFFFIHRTQLSLECDAMQCIMWKM